MRKSVAGIISAAWFLLAGGVGAILAPWWLTGWQLQHPLPGWPVAEVAGVLLIVAGLFAAVHVFVQFVRASGTPMPGAMTGRLVVSGLNAHVRNPIYLAVMTIFVGQALLFGQLSMLIYTSVVGLGTAAFVRWYEEPALTARFGADYEAYRREVPAWRPRLHPWTPDNHDAPTRRSAETGPH